MRGILSYFIRHGTVANLLLVVLLVAGAITAPRMRAQFFPDVVVDDISVSIAWDGAGAEDVDRAIVQILEPALLAVEGVTSSAATSREGRARISLEFEPGWDMARASDDVQSAVEGVSNLPDDADEPSVNRGRWRDTVTDVVITGPVAVDQLSLFADEFTTRLFQIGVTRATIIGVVAPETIVEVAALSLIRNDVSMADIAAAIAEEAEADPAGDVGAAGARVRTGVAKRSAPQIEAIVLRPNPDGSTLTIGDVAEVRVAGIDRERAFFVGSEPAMSVNVSRSAAGDAIRIQAQVEEVVALMSSTLPEGVTMELIRTRSEAISGRLNVLLSNAALGLVLVVVLLFLFLNARTALWVAAGIPVSLTAAISLMYFAGMTINMISLFALIITLGIVVDDAIVVGEHVDFRVRRLGESAVEAAENAAVRMFSPVFAATITTIIAFFGLVAIGGRFGDLILDLPLTVILVLTASLIECFLILPNHMAHALSASGRGHWYDAPSRVVNRGFGWFRDNLFRRAMAWVIWARYPVLAGSILLLSSQVALVVRGDVQWRFFSPPERSTISGNFAMAPGAGRADTREMLTEMQRAVEAVGVSFEQEYGDNPVLYVLAQIGGGTGRSLSGADSKDLDQLGAISIELTDADQRSYGVSDFVARLQDEVVRHPLAETVSFRRTHAGPGGDAIDIELSGSSASVLKAAAEDIKTSLSQYGEVSALEDSLAYDKDELVLELTPQGQALGFSIDGIGRVLRNRLNGIEAATYPDGRRSAAIRVELPASELTADFIERSQLRSPGGAYVALSDIVSVSTSQGFSTVRRENGIRLVNVTGDLDDEDAERAAQIMQDVEEALLPRIAEEYGVTWALAGLAEQENRFLSDALLGLGLALVGIFLTLAWIFGSWTRPLVVMAIIPFGLVGAIFGHAYWGVPLSMFSVVGLIGMTGIIINDSIVLVTTIDEYAHERGLIPAIIDGAADRLRPVMLTTMTTVLGLGPLLYERSADAQFLKPTVITLAYGLGFGLVLVLLVVPSLMAIQLDAGKLMRALRRVASHPARSGVAGVAVWTAGFSMALLFAVTLGSAVVQQADITAALGQFVAGAAAIAILFYVLAGLALRLRR